MSIVGESGSGKTSLIMLIGGLEKATSGKIYFEDQDLTTLSEDEVSEIRKKKHWNCISIFLFNSKLYSS